MKSVLTKMLLLLTLFASHLFADPTPDLDVVDLDGNWHNLNDYVTEGKYVALDFVTLN